MTKRYQVVVRGAVVGTYDTFRAARRRADRADNAYGAYCATVKIIVGEG